MLANINLFYPDSKVCSFFCCYFSVEAALLCFHVPSTTSLHHHLLCHFAVQTLDYSKDAEHNSSSSVFQIPPYNPQRNLLLCTRWIVCGCVHRRRRSFPDSSVVASD